MSVATRSHEHVNGGGADVNGRRSHPLITSHKNGDAKSGHLNGVWGWRDYQLMNDVGGEALLSKRKKGELWQHNKNTNIVTNSNALLFGSSRSILLRMRDRCLTSLGVDGVGVRLAMV